MNSEDRQDEDELVDWEEWEECNSQNNRIVDLALVSISDRTEAKLLKLGLTTGR